MKIIGRSESYFNVKRPLFTEPQMAMIRKYMFSITRFNRKKILNFLRLILEMKLRKTRLISRPIIARINICSNCNLRCKGCFGSKHYKRANLSSKKIMKFEDYKKAIEKVSDSLILVLLYDEGEPLLNNELSKIVSYTSTLNIATSISTNLSLPLSDCEIEELVLSKLDHLRVCIDGMTQDVYERYRQGGDLNLVKKNLEKLINIKKQKGKTRPLVELQYINFGYNEHQLKHVVRYAKSIGVDFVKTFHSLSEYHWFKYSGPEAKRVSLGCHPLWSTIHIDSAGMMFPCDFGEDNGMQDIGSIYENELDQLWNSSRMQGLRKSFYRGADKIKYPQCRSCPISQGLPFILR